MCFALDMPYGSIYRFRGDMEFMSYRNFRRKLYRICISKYIAFAVGKHIAIYFMEFLPTYL